MGFLNPTTVVLLIALVTLFISMILSSMAASDAQKGNYSSAKHYATLSSVILAIAVLLCVAAIMLYVYRLPVSAKVSSFSQSMKGWN